MKSIFLKEALAEKLLPKPHNGYIQRMNILADKGETLTLPVFKDTGRMILRDEFIDRYDVGVHDDCKHVMVYITGSHIELLSDGTWYLEIGNEVKENNHDINVLEEVLYTWVKKHYDESSDEKNLDNK